MNLKMKNLSLYLSFKKMGKTSSKKMKFTPTAPVEDIGDSFPTEPASAYHKSSSIVRIFFWKV